MEGRRKDGEGSRATFSHLAMRSSNATQAGVRSSSVYGSTGWLRSGLPESLRTPREKGALGEACLLGSPLPQKKQRGTHFPPENSILCRTHRESVFSGVKLLYTPSADSRVRSTSEARWQTEGTHFMCDLR